MLAEKQMLNQYLESDNDEDDTSPKFCPQFTRNAATKPDAEYQTYHG